MDLLQCIIMVQGDNMTKIQRALFLTSLGIMGFMIGFAIGEIAKADELDTRYKIAVIDTGFTPMMFDTTGFKLCESGHYDFNTNTPTVGRDTMGHGAYVTALINHHAQTNNICFLVYKVFGENVKDQYAVTNALIKAYKAGAKAVNMSLYMTQYSERTRRVFKYVSKRGVKLFVASGNHGVDLNKICRYYPVCYKGINPRLTIVGATDRYNRVARYSNIGAKLTVYQFGDVGRSRGTSFASPRALGDYVRGLKLDGR